MKGQINLKILTPNLIKKDILKWYEDEDVVRYSDNQYRKITLKSQKKYVNDCLESDSKFLYGIFIDEIYIGNILITNIYYYHKTGEISFFIGDKNYWGKGIMSQAIKIIIGISKNNLKLSKIYAGVASENYGSIKVLKKNKFKIEGVKKQHLIYNSRNYDQYDFCLFL